jgi:acyl carrier protein
LERFISVFKNAVNMDDSDIRTETELEGLEGWDSLGKFMLISAVYSDYGVTMDVSAINSSLTVGDIWRLIEENA